MDPHGRNEDEEEYLEGMIRENDGDDITSQYLNLEGGDDSSSHGMEGEDDGSGDAGTLMITKSGEVY